MLNPEYVDFNKGIVKIGFTDDDADAALNIYLSEADAWRLHEMIVSQCNMKAKENRSYTAYQFDPTF